MTFQFSPLLRPPAHGEIVYDRARSKHNKRRDQMSSFHDLDMDSITGERLGFDQYKGQACLIVNLATQ